MIVNYEKSILVTVMVLISLFIIAPVMAATTQVQIIRYANDNTTVLNETTVHYTWMEANLPVLGDGTTHYYHQGPVFIDDPDEAT